jgi:hypothetical protein
MFFINGLLLLLSLVDFKLFKLVGIVGSFKDTLQLLFEFLDFNISLPLSLSLFSFKFIMLL